MTPEAPDPARPAPAICDAHLHVFGPAGDYPSLPGTTAAPEATLDRYEAATAGLGVERLVLVQPSAYGTDNRCLLDALARLGPGRARGVVVPGEERPDDATLGRWQELGVRGLRCICFPQGTTTHTADGPGGRVEGWAEAVRPVLVRQLRLAAELGWHVDLLSPGWLLVELLDVLEEAPVALVFAHLGMFAAADGVDQPGLRPLLRLATEGSRHGWLKLTGPYRISQAVGHADVGELARACHALAPDRIVWGSDFPHLSFAGSVETAAMLRQVEAWLPSEGARRQVLAENAARLYGFAEEGTPR